MNAREYYTVWLSKREVEALARNLAKFCDVEVEPADLADGRLEHGAYLGPLIKRLVDVYELPERDVLWVIKQTFPEYDDEELRERVRLTAWLSKRKVKRLTEIIYEDYGVKIKPSALSSGGAQVATLFEKLRWYDLSKREIVLAIDAALNGY